MEHGREGWKGRHVEDSLGGRCTGSVCACLESLGGVVCRGFGCVDVGVRPELEEHLNKLSVISLFGNRGKGAYDMQHRQ